MKHILTLLICLFAIGFANAQSCTPDPNSGSELVYPTSLPTAYTGQVYNGVLTFNIPTDTTVAAFSVIIDSIVIKKVIGMPIGINYATNPANGNFPGGQKGCLAFIGTPANDQANKTFQLTIDAVGYGKTMGNPINYPYTFSDLSIKVEAGTGIVDLSKNTFNVKGIYPNPINNFANIDITSANNVDVSIIVKDMLGRDVINLNKNTNIGENKIILDVSSLNEGIYFCIISQEQKTFTRKMVINR